MNTRHLLPAVVLASSLSAQATWTELFPAVSPPVGAASYSGSDGALLYHFGGRTTGGVPQNDLWLFDGTSWFNPMPSGTLPSGRRWGAGCFDIGRNKFVIFGGNTTGTTQVGDTWEYDPVTNTWAQMAPAVSPSARRWAAMAYDFANGKCLMYGGQAGSTYMDDTWSWDGTNWTLETPANSPGALAGNAGIGRHRMASNVFDLEILMHAGRSGSTLLNTTFKWDGTDWSQITPATSPPPNQAASLTFDEARMRYVAFGGASSGGVPRDWTWEFDGTNWVDRGGYAGAAVSGMSMAYVSGLQKTYVFGGFNGAFVGRTHEYQTNAFATFNPNGTFGLSCPNSGVGTPTQQVTGLPWIGETFSISVQNVNGSALIQAMLLNLGAPISPINLAVIGAPACNFVAGPEISVPLVGGEFAISIPNDVGNIGLAVFTQAMTVELPFHIAASERADAVIGAL